LRILYIVNDINFFQSHRLPLALKAIDIGWDVFVASNETINIDQRITQIKIPIDRSSLSIIKSFILLFSVVKVIKKVKPTIAHNVTLKPIIIGSISAFFFPKLTVINAVSGLGVLFTGNKNSLARRVVQFLFRIIVKRKNTGFIFQNKIDLKVFQNNGLKRNFIIIKGSGVDGDIYRYQKPLNTSKKIILFTGRILKDKGVLDLIKAFKLLPENIKNQTVLRFLGNEDLENPAHIKSEYMKSLLQEGNIQWDGHSNNIKNELERCNIYCLPSYREGLPKSIVEAMAIGRPIITTNAPGCDDCVIDGFNGYKITSGDVRGLSEGLLRLLCDNKLCVSMGKNSRIFFEKEFELNLIIKETFNFYSQMLMK
jgi:glycosyltransferase involved in cell wall biosynthesis